MKDIRSMQRMAMLVMVVALPILVVVGCSPEALARNLFTLSLSSAEVTIPLTGQQTVTVTMKRGFLVDQTITLSVTGLPSGVTFALAPSNPQEGKENTTQAAQLTLTVAATVPIGTYPLTVKGVIFEDNGDGTATKDEQTQTLMLKVIGEGGDFTLTVSTDGNGTVTSEPPGINCSGISEAGSDCTEVYSSGTSVRLRATPNENFQSWSCDGIVDGTVCIVVMNQNKGVFAQFTSAPVSPGLTSKQ
jgi:hypothetical protein